MNEETKEKKSTGFVAFVKKHRVLLIVLAVIIAVCIPLMRQVFALLESMLL